MKRFFCFLLGSVLLVVSDNVRRWVVFGIELNKVLVDQIHSFVEEKSERNMAKAKPAISLIHRAHLDDLRIGQTCHQGQLF